MTSAPTEVRSSVTRPPPRRGDSAPVPITCTSPHTMQAVESLPQDTERALNELLNKRRGGGQEEGGLATHTGAGELARLLSIVVMIVTLCVNTCVHLYRVDLRESSNGSRRGRPYQHSKSTAGVGEVHGSSLPVGGDRGCHRDSMKTFADSYDSPEEQDVATRSAALPNAGRNVAYREPGGGDVSVQRMSSTDTTHPPVHADKRQLHTNIPKGSGGGGSPSNSVTQRANESKATVHAISLDYGPQIGLSGSVLRDPTTGSWMSAFGSLLWGNDGPSRNGQLPSHVTGGVHDRAPSGGHRHSVCDVSTNAVHDRVVGLPPAPHA